MQKWIFVLFFLAALAVNGQSTVPAGSKVFIAPMEGKLDGFIAPEIIKKKVPLVVVTEERDAEYILTGASIKADDKWYHVIFGGKDKNEGNVRLISVKDHQMVWAGEAGDRSLWWGGIRRGGERKVADRIVKEMKKALFSGATAQAVVPASPTPAQTEAPQPNPVVITASPTPEPVQIAVPSSNPVSTAPAAVGGGVLNITFTSNPANALVIIGGMALGRTPFTTKLPPGAYKATFAVYGYSNSVENMTVGAGYPTTVNATLQAGSAQ